MLKTIDSRRAVVKLSRASFGVDFGQKDFLNCDQYGSVIHRNDASDVDGCRLQHPIIAGP